MRWVLLVLVGCYGPHYSDCAIACAMATGCPDGLKCNGQFCRTEPHADIVCPGEIAPPDAADAFSIDAPSWNRPWGTPQFVIGDSSAGLDDPSLNSALTLMLITRTGTLTQIYRTANAGGTWTTPLVAESGLNSGSIDRGASMTEDGQSVYWASTRSGGAGSTDVWVASGGWAAWTSATNVPSASSAVYDERPAVTADLLTIVLDSNRANANDYDIFTSTRANSFAPWPTLTPIAEINSMFIDEAAMLSHDGLTIYFDSNRSGQFDIYAAHRTATNQPFGTPYALDLNDPSADDISPWISPDERTIFFATRRASANAQIYEATR